MTDAPSGESRTIHWGAVASPGTQGLPLHRLVIEGHQIRVGRSYSAYIGSVGDGPIKRWLYMANNYYELPTPETQASRMLFQPMQGVRFETALENHGWAIERGLRWSFRDEKPSRW